MFGKQFILDYVLKRIRSDRKELEYRVYITNALQCISKNTAQYEGCTYMQLSYWDMINNTVTEHSRSSEEIISSISSTLDFLGKENELNECI